MAKSWTLGRKPSEREGLICGHSQCVRIVRVQEREGSTATHCALSEAPEGHLPTPTKF